jgi:glycerol kinase
MILAIDEGTTGTHCYVFDEQGRIAGGGYAEFTQHFPQPGWVEHDASEIWEETVKVAAEALADAGIGPEAIDAIGITNQRETVVAWDRSSGEPLYRAIVWQDRRTAERCDQLKAAGHEQLVRERTGLVIDSYFSATKIEWLLRNVDGLATRAANGEICFGTIDAWLTFKLTGRAVTDYSNASRTMLFDIHELRWDPELCELFGVPQAALPEVVPSSGVVADSDPLALVGIKAPVAGIAGDQQAALYGQAAHRPGLGKNTYGTGSFVLLNTGEQAPPASPGLVTTVAWGVGGRTAYALEASMFVTGSAVQWLRDGLGIIDSAEQTEALAASLDSNDGVYFVPALVGLGSPYWDPYARGTIVGLTRGSGRAQLARATLESIAYQAVDAVEAMEQAAGERLEELRVDGGAVGNRWLMQFQADVLGRPVLVPEVTQTTALGAALLAGLAIGSWTPENVGSGWHEAARYEPLMGEDRRAGLLADWRRAVERSRGWADPSV